MENSRKIEIIDLIIDKLSRSRFKNANVSDRFSGICAVLISLDLYWEEDRDFDFFLKENRPQPDNKWKDHFIEGHSTTAWWFPHSNVDERVKFLQALKESLSPKTLQAVGFAGNPFPTGEVKQPTPTNPDDYGKTLTDENGRSYLQTKEGRIY